MSTSYQKKLQIITFFILICLPNGYVFAALPDETMPAEGANEKKLFSGILNTIGDQHVFVNGNAAFNGMTILSSTNIKTGKNSGATINLRPIGIVELAAETSVKLVFTDGQINLQLSSGNAKLTTFKSITGSLTAADGKILKTDPTLEISSVGELETTNVAALPPIPAVPPLIPAAAPGLFGMGIWETAVMFGVVIESSTFAWVAVKSTGNNNRTVSRVQP